MTPGTHAHGSASFSLNRGVSRLLRPGTPEFRTTHNLRRQATEGEEDRTSAGGYTGLDRNAIAPGLDFSGAHQILLLLLFQLTRLEHQMSDTPVQTWSATQHQSRSFRLHGLLPELSMAYEGYGAPPEPTRYGRKWGLN